MTLRWTPTDLVPVTFGVDENNDLTVLVLGAGGGGGGGAATFVGLSDTPAAYTGQGGRSVRVKADASGLEFVAPFDGAFASLTGLPTTLAGYGITDAAPLVHTQSIATIIGLTDQLNSLTDGLEGKAALVHTHAAGDVVSGVFAAARLGTGTADGTTFLRGDGTWAVPPGGGGGGDGGAWGSITGTLADQTDLQAALDAKLAASAVSSFMLTVLDDTTAAGARATLGAAGATDLTNHTNALTAHGISSFGATLVDDANAAAARTTLGAAAASHTHGVGDITATGTADGTTFLRGDGAWATPPGGGAAAWGSITGTLADQTDLQAALDGKAASVHGHAISDVAFLQSNLDAKLAASAVSAFGLTLVDDADAPAARATLGLGTAAVEAASAFEAAGGIATHAALTDGVHGISAYAATLLDDTTAAAARTTLGAASSSELTTHTGGLTVHGRSSFVASIVGSANAGAFRTAIDAAQATHTHAIADVTGLQTALDANAAAAGRFSKGITIPEPVNTDDVTLFFTDRAITIAQINAVVRGTTPSATWTIRHAADRSATGAEVVTGGTTTTSTSTGSEVTSFDDATIPAGSWVWVEVTATSGTVDELHITIEATED